MAAGDKCLPTMRQRMKASMEKLPEHACVNQLSQLLELSFVGSKSTWSISGGKWWIHLGCQRNVSISVTKGIRTGESLEPLPPGLPSPNEVDVVHAKVYAPAKAAEVSTRLRSTAIIPDRVELHRLLIPFRNAAGAYLRVEVWMTCFFCARF